MPEYSQPLGNVVRQARKKMERISVNPATGKRMLIPPKIVLNFKPNNAIKSSLKERKEL